MDGRFRMAKELATRNCVHKPDHTGAGEEPSGTAGDPAEDGANEGG